MLLPGLDFYFKGYQQVKFDRPMGFGVGFIPWTSIIKWCEVNDIRDINDIETTVRYFRSMEAAENKFEDRKAKKK